MSKHPPASREDHDDFCVNEKWQLVRGAQGKPVKHHRTYELDLWDGRILRTRISRPINKSTYSAKMWSHILKQQLEVSEASFWACVKEKQLPDRGVPQPYVSKKSIPLYLYKELTRLGVTTQELSNLNAAAAAELYSELLKSE